MSCQCHGCRCSSASLGQVISCNGIDSVFFGGVFEANWLISMSRSDRKYVYVCYTQFRRQRVKASYGVNYVKCPLHLATWCFHRHHTSLYILRGGEKFKHHLLCLQLHLYIVCIYDTLEFRVLFEPIFLFSDRHPGKLFSSPVRWVMLAVIATLLHWSTHNEHPHSTDWQQCRDMYWHTCIANDKQLKYSNVTFQNLCTPIPIVVAL